MKINTPYHCVTYYFFFFIIFKVLKLLNSNTRNPYVIWDNATRTQLLDFLEHQRTKSAKEQYEDITDIYNIVADFSFDAHRYANEPYSLVTKNNAFILFIFGFCRDELQIGGIYIRIYNEMPTFQILNPKSFIIDLLTFLNQGYAYLKQKKFDSQTIQSIDGILTPTLAANHPHRSQKPLVPKRDNVNHLLNDYNRSKARNQIEQNAIENCTTSTKYDFESISGDPIENIISVLKALISVIKHNPNVELQCIGQFDLLFGFLSTTLCARDSDIKALGLEIVSLVSRNKDCVNEIAACELLGQFLVAVKDPDLKSMQDKVLETLSGLLNVQRMVKEAHSKGAVMYLLDLFCNARNPQTRELCAEILGKMTADKLSGPKVRISVCKFFPPAFLDAMIESPAIAVQMFETTHEHPELIWNDKTRDKVIESVTSSSDSFYAVQKVNPKVLWKDPDVLQDITSTELIVSGVYLKLFISNPGWTLRKPKQFLSDLLDFVASNISRATSSDKEKDALDTSTSALVALLHAQPNLADAIPVLGHIPKFFTQLSSQPKSALKVLHQLSLSEVSENILH